MKRHPAPRALVVLLILAFALAGIPAAAAAPVVAPDAPMATSGTLDFGNTADGTTATTGNTGFGGVRIGTGGGSFTIVNPGQEIGTQAELRGIAPTTGSINSVGVTSAEYGTAATVFTVSFEVYFSGGNSGTWYFFAGNGISFAAAQSSGFTSAQVFTGLRFAYGASNAITTNNRAAGNWNTTGISGTPFAQNVPYTVSVIGNNSAAAVNYGAGTVAANKYDLWVNGTLVGDDLGKGELPAANDINAFRFYGESSTSNVATINLDNIRWWNQAVPPSMSTYSTVSSVPALTYSVLNMNSGSASLAGNVTVNELLSLNTGNLTLGTSNLTLGTSATVGGTPTATSMVVTNSTGKLCKTFGATGSFTYPIGDNTGTAEYSPATLNFTSGSFASAQACVNVTDTKHPSNSSATDYLTRYWTVSQSGITGFSCDTTFTHKDADIAGTESNLYTGQWNGTAWSRLNAANTANNTIGGTVSSFGDFTGGEQGSMGTGDTAPSVTPPTTPASSATNVSINTTIKIDFSEAVDLTASAVTLECPVGTTKTFSGLPATNVTSVTLTPSAALPNNTTCKVTVAKDEVSDRDGIDPVHMTTDYSWTFTTDTPPTVSSTVPASGATGVAATADLTVNFSEAVTVTDPWFAISCASTGVHTAVVTGGPQAYTLNPDNDFGAGESCIVTVYAAQVKDQDIPLDAMAANAVWSFTVAGAAQSCNDLFFSEYVEGSSNNKVLEIFNGKTATVNLSGYKVELYSNGATTPSTTANLSGSLAAGDVYVIANSGAVAEITSIADLISGVTNFNGDDAIALRYNTTLIDVIGQIGADPGTQWGSGLTSTLDRTLRRKSTISAGDANDSDAFDPAAEWDGYAQDTFDGLGWHSGSCGGDAAPVVASTSPADGATGVATTANIVINFSESVNVSGTWFTISCSASGAHTASVTPASPASSFTLNPAADFSTPETCTVTVYAAQVTDNDSTDPPDAMLADTTFSFGVGSAAAPCSTLPLIQGTGNTSACLGHRSNIQGCITGVTATGFYFQDAAGDGNTATSDGIFAYYYSTWTNPAALAAGDLVKVSGNVTEYYDTTEFAHKSTDALSVTKTGTCTVPAAVAVGPVTDPAADPMTQYERYEGMRVKMTFDGWVVGPTKRFDSRYPVRDPEIAFVDFGSSIADYARVFERDYTGYRGINYLGGGLNVDLPDLDFGDRIAGTDITGVLGYQFDKYTLLVDAAPSLTTVDNTDVASNEPALDETKAEFDVCFWNVENLFDNIDDGAGDWGDWAPGYPDSNTPAGAALYNSKLDKVAAVIVNKAKSCMVLGLEEMEGKQGVYNDLAARVNALDTSSHSWTGKYVESGDSRDISQGFLYRDDVTLVGGALTPVSGSPYTTWVADSTLDFVRVPASGRFRFNAGTPAERDIYLYTVHFKSKGNSTSCTMPDCTDKRELEAADLRDILAHHQGASEYAVAGGDYNDTFGSTPIAILDNASTSIKSLYFDLTAPERYSYIFNGESEVLDHYYVTKNLIDATGWSRAFSPVHVNADFPAAEHASDHDPLRGRFRWMSDYSDLPAYGNAYHIGDGTWRLGTAWSDDSSFSATDSDDGVTRDYAESWNDTRGEVRVTVTGPAGQWACLNAWLDYSDGAAVAGTVETPDGQFNAANEHVVANKVMSPGASQLVTWTLEQGVINGAATYNMRFRLVPAPNPAVADCSGVTLAAAAAVLAPDGGALPTGRADGGEVEDYTFNPGPLAVTLASFTAATAADGVTLAWETVSEADNAGFNLYRAGDETGPWVKLNAALIPAAAPGSSGGHAYTWTDATAAGNTAYVYRLEAVALDGTAEILDTLGVTFRPAQRRWLPLVR